MSFFNLVETHVLSSIRDPQIAFGRLVVAGTGIPTAVLADRFDAGDLSDDLAEDYGLDRRRVEEAIRCERVRRAA